MVYHLYSSLHRYLLLPLIVLFLFLPSIGHCNDIQISNSKISESSEEGVRFVEFDLSWDNSWRTDNLVIDDGRDVGNWDAAWIFVKYRKAGSVWKHAKLLMDGHELGTGTNATIQVGVPDQNADWHALENPGVGAMVYRSETGSGTFAVEQMKLRWDYGTDNLDPEAEYILEIYAIEMVSVMPGPYFLGSGGSEESRFIAGGSSTNEPFLVTSEWNGCISDTEGCLWATGDMDEGGVLPEGYPTGWDGFYVMKYEISQQQYVDFLNTLTPEQASERAYTGGANRNGITQEDGYYVTSRPYVANNYMSWEDGISYLDWAGLRPLTELEFEKAARGYADPVADEYAWGSTELVLAEGLASAGGRTETVVPESANAHGNSSIDGPVRVGVFADATSNRVTSGSSYWGVMELSGNVWERYVTAGNESGRLFSSLHGDGGLTSNGFGNVPLWPGYIDSSLTNLDGSGFRGGAYTSSSEDIKISSRSNATLTISSRANDSGFRGARSMMRNDLAILTTTIIGNGIISPSMGVYEIGSTIHVVVTPNSGWELYGWLGYESVTNDSLAIEIAEDTNISVFLRNWSIDSQTQIVEVTNPETGKTWMDRNLGATYQGQHGNLYQWGREADGHQLMGSSQIGGTVNTDQPGHDDFLMPSYSPYDWRDPSNNNLWKGIGGTNNPCPFGYRIPTGTEWAQERNTWSSDDGNGSANSPLVIPASGGFRSHDDGRYFYQGDTAYYWNDGGGHIFISAGGPNRSSGYRATGYQVRCIKN